MWSRLKEGWSSPVTAIGMLILVVCWPVVRAGYPTIGDGLIHFYRLVEFDHLLRQGVWFPRWAADLGYGYGYPLFNFYPPLAYYLGATFHAFGLSIAQSLLAVYCLALSLAVMGTYGLAREWWGETSGLIAASAYGFAPYFYFDVLARGALPETFGLGLLPLVLWAYLCHARRPTAITFLVAAFSLAALFLTHLLSALLALPLILGVVVSQSPFSLRHGSFSLIPSLLSLTLSAYFLLPALLETSLVQISQLTTPGDLDFHQHFLNGSQLFAWPQPLDPQLVFVAVNPSLSLVVLGWALLNSLRKWTWLQGGLWGAFWLYVFLITPLATPVWESLPFAQFIQFPWRLVGPASLLIALLAAAPSRALPARFSPLASLLPLLIFFFYSLSWTYSAPFNAPLAPTVRDLAAYEATGQLGTTATGEFLPTAVQRLPAPDSLQAQYAETIVINRLAALPEGVTLIAQTATTQSASATVEAHEATTLTFNVFYFPGWRATIDNISALITPSTPHGLITVVLPPGVHTVSIEFASTPLRTFASALSLISLVGCLALFLRFPSPLRSLTPSPVHRRTSPSFSLLSSLFSLFFLFTLLSPPPASRFNGATVAGVGQTLDVNFDNQLVLIGLDLSPPPRPADKPVPLTLYWRAQNIPSADYSTSVQVVDAAGNLFGQSDAQHPGHVPTSRWRLDQYARDEHQLTLLPGTPPGVYTLRVSVYQVGATALSVLDEAQNPRGTLWTLGTVTVTAGSHPPAQLDATQLRQDALGPLTLVGQTIAHTTTLQAGDEAHLTLFWRAVDEGRPDATLLLELIAGDQVIASQSSAPVAGYPTSRWGAGEIVRAPLRLRVPAAAPEGVARLQITLLSAEGVAFTEPLTLSPLELHAPARSFVIPAIQHPRQEILGGKIKLLGYALTETGVSVYWQALAEMNTSYTAFAHGLDGAGHLVAQVDAIPLNGARPTTGWLPGEVVLDHYPLSLTEVATLELGFYDEHGNRLGVVMVREW